MEAFPRYWSFVWGIHRSQVNSPHKGQWRRALMFLSSAAGDLRRHGANYDVIVMNDIMRWKQFPHYWLFVRGFYRSLLYSHTKGQKCESLVFSLLLDAPITTQRNAYSKTYNIRRTLVGNKIVDHSDVVGASPVGAAPTTSSFST